MRGLKKSSSNSQDTRKIRKILHEEVRLGINTQSDSESEDLDLHKELYPLNHYINNREEMIEQMFSIIKGAKLKKMLPPILKDMPLDELKADCLIHLLGMSTKRINAILEGREIESSSESETHSDSSTTPNKKSTSYLKPIIIKQEGCSDISDNSEEVVLVDPDSLDTSPSKKRKGDVAEGHMKAKKHHSLKSKRKISEERNKKDHKRRTEKSSVNIEVSEESPESISDNEDDKVSVVPTEGKTLLEILELEMRARAIRALLQKGTAPEGDGGEDIAERPSQSKQNVSDVPNKTVNESDSGADKITPVRNFRKKKKRKSDDVIVITPKVVTIDLTDENEPLNVKNKKKILQKQTLELDGLLSNVQTNTSQKELLEEPEKLLDLGENSGSCKTKPVCEHDSEKEKTANTSPVALGASSEKTSEQLGLENKLDLEDSEKSEQPKTNWAQRWLESKEVKKVVSTSKICGNIRKRIKSAKLAKQSQESSPKGTPEQQDIQGSVDEYQLLPKSSWPSDSNDATQKSNILKVNTPPMTGEGEINEKPSVDQVQDITSTETHSENMSQEQIALDSTNLIDKSSLGDSENMASEFKQIDSTHSKNNTLENQVGDKNIFITGNPKSYNVTNPKLDLLEFHSETVIGKSLNSQSGSPNSNDQIHEFQIDSEKALLDPLDVKDTKSLLFETDEIEVTGINKKPLQLEMYTNFETEVCESNVTQNTFQSITTSKINIVSQSATIDVTTSENCDPKTSPDKLREQTNDLRNADIKTPMSTSTKIFHDKNSPNGNLENVNEPETLEINITDEDREID